MSLIPSPRNSVLVGVGTGKDPLVQAIPTAACESNRYDAGGRGADLERITGHGRRTGTSSPYGPTSQTSISTRRRLTTSKGGSHQSWTEPSRRRLTGRYFGSYGYRAAAFSSNVTPRPGW
jgi:hypothetical protein